MRVKGITIARYAVASALGVSASYAGVDVFTWGGAALWASVSLVYAVNGYDIYKTEQRARMEGQAAGFLAGLYYSIGRLAAAGKEKAE